MWRIPAFVSPKHGASALAVHCKPHVVISEHLRARLDRFGDYPETVFFFVTALHVRQHLCLILLPLVDEITGIESSPRSHRVLFLAVVNVVALYARSPGVEIIF